ncbi:MAG: hypothetical protein LBD76_00755 [Prevotellaceae bacterium]|nr:hypothetical protein [Prevotellaceae bacterium]
MKILFTAVEQNAPLWKIEPMAFEQIRIMISTFEIAYEKAKNPNRGKADVQAKNDARDTLKKAVRKFVKEYLAFNSNISNEERERIGLPVYKTGRTPAPVADDAPDFDVNTSLVGRITILFFERGKKHKKGKPAGQFGVEIAWVVSDTPPTRWEELLHSDIDTSSPFTLAFENDQRGKTLYFALRWENTRGKKGPWSSIANAIIP